MKCKYAGVVAANSRSASKWIHHLGAEALGEASVVDAIGVRQRLLRHVERTEQKIPDRERAGEVLSAAAIRRGVVPAMKHRPGDHVFEWAKRPVQIGMHEGRRRGREWSNPQHHVG